MKNLRFEFRVLDADGECLASDWTTITDTECIDKFGACETVDIYVGTALRAIKRDREAELSGVQS